jgi:hypothetical protein
VVLKNLHPSGFLGNGASLRKQKFSSWNENSGKMFAFSVSNSRHRDVQIVTQRRFVKMVTKVFC